MGSDAHGIPGVRAWVFMPGMGIHARMTQKSPVRLDGQGFPKGAGYSFRGGAVCMKTQYLVVNRLKLYWMLVFRRIYLIFDLVKFVTKIERWLRQLKNV